MTIFQAQKQKWQKKANVTAFFDLRQMLTCRFAAGKKNEKSVVLRWFVTSISWEPISVGYSHSIHISTQYFKLAQLTVWFKFDAKIMIKSNIEYFATP